jgi:hypothetical protein
MLGPIYSATSDSSWKKWKIRRGLFRGSCLDEVILAIWCQSARRSTSGAPYADAWNSRKKWKARNVAFCSQKNGLVSMPSYFEWRICKPLRVESTWPCKIRKLQMNRMRKMKVGMTTLRSQIQRSPARLVASLTFPLGVLFDQSTQHCLSHTQDSDYSRSMIQIFLAPSVPPYHSR